MSGASEAQHEILALIERQTLAAGALAAALERERTALATRDAQALETALADKRAALEELESLARALAERLERAGYRPDLDGVRACLASAPASAREHLAELELRLRTCVQANRRNGEILARCRERLEAAFAVLRGESPQAALYGPGGRAISPGGISAATAGLRLRTST